jgi:Uma2 family endonuclease
LASIAQYDYLPQLILNKPVRKCSLEQYIRKEEKANEKYEFFDGRIEKMPLSNGPHNILTVNIAFQIRQIVEKLNQNAIVLISKQKVYIPYHNAAIYPDALAVTAKPLFWDDWETLLINPVLVVEILTKNKKKYNRNRKYEYYKSLESIKEYVLIHQDEYYIEVWHREKPEYWRETFYKNSTEKIALNSLKVNISMEDIYHNISIDN